ncbi:MAG TPA: BTAD domain-containing putative transcriptional regulator, partial [Acidiferrobacterales bacterium]
MYLALPSGTAFRRRDSVVGLFWPELDDEHARGSLRQALTFLRRTLGDGVIVTRGEEEIGLDRAAAWCDAAAFIEAADAGHHAEALQLYRGDFLDGLFVSDAAPEFERWVEDERAELRRRAASAAWALAQASRVAGERAQAMTLARRAAGFAPEDEGQLARLIVFLDELGDRAGAMGAYDEFARRLRREYDAVPAPETQALMRSIRTRAAVVGGDVAVAPARDQTEAGQRSVEAQTVPGRLSTTARAAIYLAALGFVAVAGYLLARKTPWRVPAQPTVAVLPFEDLSGDTAQRYVADGLTEQLITDLAQTGALQVINRRTMMAYRDSANTSRAVARALRADAVVSGTVQRIGDTVHMTAQLVLAGEDRAAWAIPLEGSRGDLLRMQREVARAVTRQLRIPPTRQTALTGAPRVDPEAFDLYTRGRHWWNRRGKANLLRSIELFAQALDVDPAFALAHSGMADAYVQLGYGSYLAPSDAFPKAAEAARRALTLDSNLAEPHATL